MSYLHKESFYYAYWGFIIGDALGVPFEFKTREEMKLSPVSTMTGWGSHNQPVGTWSDDTSMMLCVLENISEKGNATSLAVKFSKWFNHGDYSAHNEIFDIGNTTLAAIEQFNKGIPAMQCGKNIQHNAGNGALMRSIPYAFMHDFSRGNYWMVIENKITHANSLSNYCCNYYTKLIRSLAEGKNKTDATKTARGWLQFGWRITDDDCQEVQQPFQRLFGSDFAKTEEHQIKSTGYVIETLEAVVWSFMNSTSYEDAVLKAVHLGGDTDTIAALTGALAAVYYQQLPEAWKSSIVKHNWLERFFEEKVV